MISKRFMNTLLGIYSFILLGLLVFSLDSYFMAKPMINSFPKRDLGLYLVPLTAMMGYFGSQFIFSRMLKSAEKENDIPQKMVRYLRTSIYRYIFLGGAALVGILAFRESRYVFYLVIVVSLIAYLLKLRPSKKKVIHDLKLDGHYKKTP